MKMVKKILPNVIVGLFCMIMLVVYMVTSGSYRSVLSEQEAQIQSLTNQIEMKKVSAQKEKDVAQQEITGLNTDRVTADDKVAEKFLKQAMEWDSYDSYMNVRSDIAETYHLDDNSSFLTTFFPEVEILESPDGSTYNIIDDGTFGMSKGMNIHYSGMKSYVIMISGDVYSYLTKVTLTTNTDNGGSAITQCAFLYDVDGNGTLSNLKAYTLTA